MTRRRRKPLAIALIALMVVGSLAMWIAVPIGWLWIASQLQSTTQPKMWLYVMVLIGIPVSMVIVSRALSTVNRWYGEVTGEQTDFRFRAPWMKSMRGERGHNRPRTVLDLVMVLSVSIALIAGLIWFLFFAGSSLPTT